MGYRHELKQEKIRNEDLDSENKKLKDQLTSAENLVDKTRQELEKCQKELKTYKLAFHQINSSTSIIERPDEYVYILRNPAFQKYLKIGMTTRHPNERVKELNSGTGIPEPFKIVFFARCHQSHRVEARLHSELNEFRVKPSREFFEIELDKALNMLSVILDKNMDAIGLNVMRYL